jgi:hypothetical protein
MDDTRPARRPSQRFGSVVAAGYRRLTGPNPVHPVVGPGSPATTGDRPEGTTAGLVPTSIDDDASHLSEVPGSYEWWNFFAMDTGPGPDLAVSVIFMPANLFDTRYRTRVHRFRDGLDREAPSPRDFPLLQLNVMHGGRKVFTTVRHPPGCTTEFSGAQAEGRIGESTFTASVEGGETVFRVTLDHPDMVNLSRVRGELTFRSPDGGFALGAGGLYGAIPGGVAHQWQFPLGLPQVHGHLRVETRSGRVKLDAELAGTGYTDHCWGEGLLGDVVDRWYFGRVDLGDDGAVLALWLSPRVGPGYGRVLRLRPGRAPVVHEVHDLETAHPWRGSLGMTYCGEVTFVVRDGRVRMRFPRRLGEDWPFQVAGEGAFDLDLAGDVVARNRPGPVEHLSQPLIDDRFFGFLDAMVPRLPWFG